jgi:hypothetical protein
MRVYIKSLLCILGCLQVVILSCYSAFENGFPCPNALATNLPTNVHNNNMLGTKGQITTSDLLLSHRLQSHKASYSKQAAVNSHTPYAVQHIHHFARPIKASEAAHRDQPIGSSRGSSRAPNSQPKLGGPK